MNIKAITFLAGLILFAFIVNGQNREDRVSLTFDKKTSKLTKAIGWNFNETTGKWIANVNVIHDKQCPSYWVSHISQNFKWIQFASLTHNDSKYFVFLWERLGGSYKYPSIMEEWEEDTRTYFFILDSKQYTDLKAVVNNKEKRDIQFKSKIYGHISDRFKVLGGEYLYNENNLLAKINNALNKEGYSEEYLIINSQNLEGKDIVRFLLPENHLMIKYYKKAYFEVNLQDFSTILTLDE
jgi:hypothetical protein